MSNRPFDETYIWKLAEGERFSRPREFTKVQGPMRDECGEVIDDSVTVDEWWLGRPSPYKSDRRVIAVAEGREFIEVVEIVASGTLGKIAIYRQWITDPDGGDCTAPWAPRRSKMLLRRESTLRSTLNGGDYYRESVSKPTPTKPKAKPKLRIVAFQARVH
jgi:hypothetical protein